MFVSSCLSESWLVPLLLVLVSYNSDSPSAHPVTEDLSRNNRPTAAISRQAYETYWTEKYKRKILNRLHLNEPPRLNASLSPEKIWSSIPHYLKQSIERQNSRFSYPTTEYLETNAEVIILAKPTLRCPFNVAAGCFVLDILDNVPRQQLLKVTLNAESSNRRLRGKTLSLWEAYTLDNGGVILAGNEPIYRTIVQSWDDSSNVAPIAFEMTSVFSSWLRVRQNSKTHRKVSRTIVVRCDNCDFTDRSPIDNDKVILEILYRPQIRQKRSSDSILNECSPAGTMCCTKRFTIDFREIKWDFIVLPIYMNVNYCHGRCYDGNHATGHAEVLGLVSKLPSSRSGLTEAQRKEISPCCAPRELQSRMMLYIDTNGVARVHTMPNLTVKRCGCV